MKSCQPLLQILLSFLLIICLGACAQPERSPNPPPQVSTTNRYQLAIFPWDISGGFQSDLATATPNGKAALERALNGSDFVPVASYYDLDAYPVTRLQKREVPKLRQMWRRAPDGHDEPNLDVILPLGTKLGVDAILIYAMEVNAGDDDIGAFLVDVARQTTYKSHGQVYDFAEDAPDALFKMTQYVFSEYIRHHGSKRVQ
ncbi:MAG: hypothetical protein ETSY1_22355 [Candidatus Entotheonella factor]|uniref:Lipoprotein n=1 Tax=Entotheonella factor TaxID=1429438 RepID=W4LHD2_ENTF1|nr:hypothetical protein [Candidatus Entotheonella palauensis]ETW97518.1 MAG: hypothetical protein ETSY1_22355 [Candidatus Entotheonella factor]